MNEWAILCGARWSICKGRRRMPGWAWTSENAGRHSNVLIPFGSPFFLTASYPLFLNWFLAGLNSCIPSYKNKNALLEKGLEKKSQLARVISQPYRAFLVTWASDCFLKGAQRKGKGVSEREREMEPRGREKQKKFTKTFSLTRFNSEDFFLPFQGLLLRRKASTGALFMFPSSYRKLGSRMSKLPYKRDPTSDAHYAKPSTFHSNVGGRALFGCWPWQCRPYFTTPCLPLNINSTTVLWKHTTQHLPHNSPHSSRVFSSTWAKTNLFLLGFTFTGTKLNKKNNKLEWKISMALNIHVILKIKRCFYMDRLFYGLLPRAIR